MNYKHIIKERCAQCGSKENLTVDHIIPKAEGGSEAITNLQILCSNCNLAKGNIPPFWMRVKIIFRGDLFKMKNEMKSMLASRFGELKVWQITQDKAIENNKNNISNNAGQLARAQVRLDTHVKHLALMTDNYNKLIRALKLQWDEEKQDYVKIKVIKNKPNAKRSNVPKR